MLTVEEAIKLLSSMNKKAVLIINGQTVDGIEGPVTGRLVEGYAIHEFSATERGRENGVFLTRLTEQSDGVFRPIRL